MQVGKEGVGCIMISWIDQAGLYHEEEVDGSLPMAAIMDILGGMVSRIKN